MNEHSHNIMKRILDLCMYKYMYYFSFMNINLFLKPILSN